MKRYNLTLCLIITSVLIALGQQTTSPYSMYAYGLLRDHVTSAQRQMGGTGYAQQSGRQINAMNPASYAATDSMTFLFDIGADVSWYKRSDATGTDRDWGGGIDYVTIQFPVSKTVGMSAGLVPFSSVGYSFGSDIKNGVATHQGLGGINQLYLGAGWRPFKGFSIGANISYMFGTLANDTYATAASGTNAVFEQMMEVRDYHLHFGAQYALQLTREHSVTLGVSYEPGKDLLGHTYVLKYLESASKADTIAPGVVGLKGRFAIASTYGAGIAWDWNRQAHIEADFTYQPWAKVKYAQLENYSDTRLANRWRVGVGGSYIPNPRGGYFKRMAYRAGAFYNRDYIMVGTNNVRDWGVSMGFGFPASGAKTMVNLGVEYLQRQATPTPMLKEKYVNITLGVNFDQLWFYRSRLR